jgi:hypothetical protein
MENEFKCIRGHEWMAIDADETCPDCNLPGHLWIDLPARCEWEQYAAELTECPCCSRTWDTQELTYVDGMDGELAVLCGPCANAYQVAPRKVA